MVTPAVIKTLTDKDTVMVEIVDQMDLPFLQSSGDVFYDLSSCILDQQIHYRSKGTYMKKFLELSDGEMPSPLVIKALVPEDFVQKKIAGNKYAALQNLASYWSDHKLDIVGWTGLTYDEIVERLSPIRGIGSWTIHMIMLYTLQHPDIFDPNDYQLKKIMKEMYGLEDSGLTTEMTRISENWKPYRSYATRYLLEWGKTSKLRS